MSGLKPCPPKERFLSSLGMTMVGECGVGVRGTLAGRVSDGKLRLATAVQWIWIGIRRMWLR
jgi:hypothetical protein